MGTAHEGELSIDALGARVSALESELRAERRRTEIERERAEIERGRADKVSAERDRLREAYRRLQLELALLHRRIFVAKAERIDSAQLELEFADKRVELAKLASELGSAASGEAGDELPGLVDDDTDTEADAANQPAADPKRKRPGRSSALDHEAELVRDREGERVACFLCGIDVVDVDLPLVVGRRVEEHPYRPLFTVVVPPATSGLGRVVDETHLDPRRFREGGTEGRLVTKEALRIAQIDHARLTGDRRTHVARPL